jgi:hypothetical protein
VGRAPLVGEEGSGPGGPAPWLPVIS